MTKKSAPVVKDDTVTKEPEVEVTPSPSQSVRDLILKAVEMTKTLPVSNDTDINSPYFVQNCYCITNNGDLILTGKPFGSNVDGEGLDKYRKNHRKYAKTMKASEQFLQMIIQPLSGMKERISPCSIITPKTRRKRLNGLLGGSVELLLKFHCQEY